MGKYDDIINLPYPFPKKHKEMSMEDRAAQFAPFAALVGFDDQIHETGRLTDTKITLDEGVISMLNEQISAVSQKLEKGPVNVLVTGFVPDLKKEGGHYETMEKTVKKIDMEGNLLIFTDETDIRFDDLLELTIKRD